MGSYDRPGDLIVVEYPRGIYLPEADLWLDPHFGVERAFVSHAHSHSPSEFYINLALMILSNLAMKV